MSTLVGPTVVTEVAPLSSGPGVVSLLLMVGRGTSVTVVVVGSRSGECAVDVSSIWLVAVGTVLPVTGVSSLTVVVYGLVANCVDVARLVSGLGVSVLVVFSPFPVIPGAVAVTLSESTAVTTVKTKMKGKKISKL